MNCEYFGKCGSCVLYDKSYEEQLSFKIQREKERFSNFTNIEFDIIKSEEKAFRNRAEFRIWWEKDESGNEVLSFAMNDFNKNILQIESCQIVSSHIQEIMPKLLALVSSDIELANRLFAVEFLGSTTNDLLVTLIYHKKLEESWNNLAKELEAKLNIKVMGRSRKQKILI